VKNLRECKDLYEYITDSKYYLYNLDLDNKNSYRNDKFISNMELYVKGDVNKYNNINLLRYMTIYFGGCKVPIITHNIKDSSQLKFLGIKNLDTDVIDNLQQIPGTKKETDFFIEKFKNDNVNIWISACSILWLEKNYTIKKPLWSSKEDIGYLNFATDKLLEMNRGSNDKLSDIKKKYEDEILTKHKTLSPIKDDNYFQTNYDFLQKKQDEVYKKAEECITDSKNVSFFEYLIYKNDDYKVNKYPSINKNIDYILKNDNERMKANHYYLYNMLIKNPVALDKLLDNLYRFSSLYNDIIIILLKEIFILNERGIYFENFFKDPLNEDLPNYKLKTLISLQKKYNKVINIDSFKEIENLDKPETKHYFNRKKYYQKYMKYKMKYLKLKNNI
jgi:hypothetical protein